MANQRVSNTALGAVICRLIEQYQPEHTPLSATHFALGRWAWVEWEGGRSSASRGWDCLVSSRGRRGLPSHPCTLASMEKGKKCRGESEHTRLFHDPLVKDLVGTPSRVLMQFSSMRNLTMQQMDAITPGIYGVQISRTRFIDDAVRDAISDGIEQVVILGAGLDTCPCRLAGMEHARVLEVDLLSVQEDKKKKLHKHFGRLPQPDGHTCVFN